jgi:hypothetical protein
MRLSFVSGFKGCLRLQGEGRRGCELSPAHSWFLKRLFSTIKRFFHVFYFVKCITASVAIGSSWGRWIRQRVFLQISFFLGEGVIGEIGDHK